MTAIEFHPRIIENKDWATVLFMVSFGLIVLTRSLFENRFHDFIRIIISDKYLKIYKEINNLMGGFTIFLFTTNLISLTFFIQLIFHHLGYGLKTDWVLFVQIFTFLTIFILSKFLVERIIATTFGIEEIIEGFNLQKVSFRTYLGVLLLPITLVLYYNDILTDSLLYALITILLVINILTYLFSLKMYQNLIISKLFYFILYLCALEIGPYYFLYYWITKLRG
jgi:hypothetical protein